jgi:putative oxidoreductase
MSLGRLVLRGTVGGFFVGHGTQKLFGWFDGHGLDATSEMFGQLGMRPPRAHAVAAGVAEAGGGAALALGAFTPLAGSVLIATMITAIQKVHAKNGPWAAGGGYEYNAVLIAAAVTLAETGPGSPSIDAARDSEMSGPGWAALSLALGALGAFGAHAISSRFPEPEPEPAEPAADHGTAAEPGDTATP